MKKKKLGSVLENVGSAAKGLIDKTKTHAVQAMDQNNDGKFDISDVSIIAGAVGDTVKKRAAAVKEGVEDSHRRMELRSLQPIFLDTLEQTEFLLSKFIRVTERDKKYAESDVCQGSIGFLSNKGGIRVVNIFKDSLNAFGLQFYPDAECEFYYVNPTDKNTYIALDEYFSYLKTVRVNELQRVAQDLGAKHFRVIYKEERISFSETKAKAQAKAAGVGNAEGEHDLSEEKCSVNDVAAGMFMEGHAPQEPELVYLLKDDNVQNLIHLRMKGGDGFHHHKISIKLSNSSGLKESDAVKIDAFLKGVKVSGNATVVSEAKNESRRYFEYEIDF